MMPKSAFVWMYHAPEIANNVRPGTRDMSLALHDSAEAATCCVDIDTAIA